MPNKIDGYPTLWSTAGATGRYIALSHRWGSSVTVTTTKQSLKSHKKEIVLEHLPKTFRDAIALTKYLGVEYLWIDSLCIIQDSKEDWEIECSKMALTFANATLVVAAVAAHDSSCGFLNPRLLIHSPTIRYRLREGIFRPKLSSTADLPALPLSSRAWAYQERLLAPRLLSFTDSQMIWECGEVVQEEGLDAVLCPPVSISKKAFFRSLDYLDERDRLGAYEQIEIDKMLQEFDFVGALEEQGYLVEVQEIREVQRKCFVHKFSELRNTPRSTFVHYRLNAWCSCVEEYSIRHLTFGSDKLPALSGLASAIHDSLMGVYLAGIWSTDLATGLLWFRHRAREDLYKHKFTKCTSYRAPTWSWASHDGPISISRQRDLSQDLALSSDLLLNDNNVSDHNEGKSEYTESQVAWREEVGARLVKQEMILASSDPYGQVMRGSNIILYGYSHPIFVYPSRSLETTPETESITVNRDHPGGKKQTFILDCRDSDKEAYSLFLICRSKVESQQDQLRPWIYYALILGRVPSNDVWKETHLERFDCCVIAESELYDGHDIGHKMKGRWRRKQIKLY